MPSNIIPALVGIAVLVAIAGLLDWLIANPVVPFAIAAAAGGGFFWWRRKRSHW